MKNNFLFKYLLLSFIYFEFAFKVINNINLLGISTFFVCTVACIFTVLMCLVIDFFKHKGKLIISEIILFIFAVYFSAHTCLFKFYKFYFEFSTLALLDQAAAFASDGLKVIGNNILYIIIFFVPFIALIFLRKFIEDTRTDIKISIIIFVAGLMCYLPFALDPYGYVYKTFATKNMIQVVNKNGVLSGLGYDIYNSLTGKNNIIDNSEEIIIENDDNKYEANVFDIDFEELNKYEIDNRIKDLNTYFASKNPTKQNEYTSFFKDKNLILFMAESFNGIAINPDLTPTLYKLAHNGFEFNNFYSPTIYSTIGGEFCELTGLYQDIEALSIFRSNRNTYPMGIANLFKEKGYKTYSYHDSTYDFQDRNLYLTNLGFENYNASGLGLEKKMNCAHWPASDVEMINVTFDDYINNDKFMVFYATVSGHGPYLFDEKENQIAPKYKDMLKEYYGDKLGTGREADLLMAYQAGQIELDRALEKLIEKLSQANKLDDTVIALVGDHHPYYLTDLMDMEHYNKLSTYERDEYIELYHSNFILYNSKMDKVSIDKVGSQLDVIPTIYNLFGLNFDSRLLMGTDLLSNNQSIAIMGDDSWVSDYGKYYASTGSFVPNDDIGLGDSYVKLINKKVKNIQKVSLLMMQTNYYQYIYKNK